MGWDRTGEQERIRNGSWVASFSAFLFLCVLLLRMHIIIVGYRGLLGFGAGWVGDGCIRLVLLGNTKGSTG